MYLLGIFFIRAGMLQVQIKVNDSMIGDQEQSVLQTLIQVKLLREATKNKSSLLVARPLRPKSAPPPWSIVATFLEGFFFGKKKKSDFFVVARPFLVDGPLKKDFFLRLPLPDWECTF